jgi:hypothetical protein
MSNFLEISILLVSTIFDHVTLFLTSLSEVFFLILITFALLFKCK